MVLNHFADLPALSYSRKQVFAWLALSAIASATLLVLSHRLILRWLVRSGWLAPAEMGGFARRQGFTYLVFLLFGAGATGFRLREVVFAASVVGLFCLGNALLVFAAPNQRGRPFSSPVQVAVLFFVSGIAALVYQVTWQRALFACFGVNIESATLVVTIFMFGLGVGSIGGGLVSRHADAKTLIQGFLACELIVGAFGLISIPLIRAVGNFTVSSSLPVTALVIFSLLSIPTLLMGATLPLLVTYAYREFSNVGRSVGLLYFVNTMGSALACYLTADLLFLLAGEHAATIVAACLNFAVAFAVYRMLRGVLVETTPHNSEAEPLTAEAESAR